MSDGSGKWPKICPYIYPAGGHVPRVPYACPNENRLMGRLRSHGTLASNERKRAQEIHKDRDVCP